jgi:choline kinase
VSAAARPGRCLSAIERLVQALILAAGNGSRLDGEIGHKPKCLAEVGGKTLIDHQLRGLAAAGIDSVVVVAGFEHDQVRAAVGRRAAIVLNQRYAATNSMYSFLLAEALIDDAVLVLNCDVLFPAALLSWLCAAPGSVVAFDSRSGHDDEHMKVALDDGCLVEMSKQLAATRIAGENLGVLRLDRYAATTAFAAARGMVQRGQEREWLASALNCAARSHRIAGLDVAGLPWAEIDFPEDLHRARAQVWPAISEFAGSASAPAVPASASGVERLVPIPA